MIFNPADMRKSELRVQQWFYKVNKNKHFGTLTHSLLMHPFSNPLVDQKTVMFSDVFRG